MANQDGPSRRAVLKMTGVSLAGIAAATGVASARADHAGEQGPPDHAKATGWLKKKGNRVELAVTEDEYRNISASMVEGVPDNARRIPFRALELQAQAINEALESNRMEIQNNGKGEELSLEQKGKLTSKRGGKTNDV